MRVFLRNSIALSWGGAMVTLGIGLQEESNAMLTFSAILATTSLVLMGIALIYFYNKVWKKK